VPEPLSSGLREVAVVPGDHICALYAGTDERNALLGPYLHAGLAAGDKCVCVADDADRPDLLSAIDDGSATSNGQVDAASCIESRQLELVGSDDAYLRTGSFSVDDTLEFWREGNDDALDAGYRFVRNAGDTRAMADMVDELNDLAIYEVELNRFVTQHPQTILCLYDVELYGGRVVLDLLRTHPKMLLSGHVIENPYYVAPDDYVATRRDRGQGWAALTEVERYIAELAATGASTVEIADRAAMAHPVVDRHLHQIYRTLAVSSRDELIRVVTERGRRR
jgi:DNA-binding CsgD family transcriptional regulator